MPQRFALGWCYYGDQMNTLTDPDQHTLVDDPDNDIASTRSKQNGEDAEQWVIDNYDLDPRDPERFPESCHDVVDPVTGRPGEVKSCVVRYNTTGRRGSWQIWDYAHQELLAHDGFYVFVVHEPKVQDFHVYLHRPLSAAQVEELITSWYQIDHEFRPDPALRTDLAQSKVFSDIQVNRLDPEPEEQNGEQADEERPEFDADVIEEGPPQVERVKQIKDIISDIEASNTNDMAPEPRVLGMATDRGLTLDQAKHQIQELKKRGEIYEPQQGALRTT